MQGILSFGELNAPLSDAPCMLSQSMLQDTTIKAQRAQVAAYRRMQPSQRVALAAQMSEEARRITESGIRARRPDLSDEDIRKHLLRTLLGETLYLKCGIDERR